MSRERLTITLQEDVLEALDATIDGQRLRNRSHAIEYYLAKALGKKALKVLILAGGKPVYFESEKKSLPKAMVKIAGKPLLEHTLLKLKNAKFSEVIISIAEGGESIKEHFGDGHNFGLHISYLHQHSKILGTAQALMQAKESLGSGNFLLLYGDVLSDVDFTDMIQFHSQNKPSVCTMALTSTESVNMWGLVKMLGSRVVDFEEKPQNPKTFSRLVNAGIYVMENEIFSLLNNAKKLESDVFPRLAQEGKLYGYLHEGMWLDVSNSAAYKQAVKEVKSL
jgi:mannose-1-phosphate guanylyltransferase/phosphomannomutase